jgi:hypothetical protein
MSRAALISAQLLFRFLDLFRSDLLHDRAAIRGLVGKTDPLDADMVDSDAVGLTFRVVG